MVRKVVHKYYCCCDLCGKEIEPKDLHAVRLDCSTGLLIDKDLCADCANRVAEAIRMIGNNAKAVE